MTDTTDTKASARPACFQDPSLPVEERVELLLAQMTLEEKAGLFFQAMITISEDGLLTEPNFGAPSGQAPGRGVAVGDPSAVDFG